MRVGITGGIGSGKTTACKEFERLGIPVFYADEVAKTAYSDSAIREQVLDYFGTDSYVGSAVDREWMAQRIFSDPEAMRFINQLIHPWVGLQFKEWMSKQSAPYVMREAAILIESGSYRDLDAVVVVTASEEARVNRVVQYRNMSKEDALRRMRLQLSDAERLTYADYVIENNEGLEELRLRIKQVHEDLLRRANQAH